MPRSVPVSWMLLISLVANPVARAESEPSPETPPKSVYRISGVTDGIVIGVASLGYLLPAAFDTDLVTRRCPCDPAEVNPVDRPVIGNNSPFASSLSDVTVAAALAFPVFHEWRELGLTRAFAEDLIIYLEVLTVNGALTSLAKYASQRPLPIIYAEPDSELASQPGGFRSFYSGHASTIFSSLSAFSMTYSLRHDGGSWPWIVTGAAGLSVMVERVVAGRHFYSDVLFGALGGLAVGTLIPLLHQRSPDSRFAMAPIAAPERLGVSLEWKL